jgi:uncharacterized protein YbgA (DUF1722 family)/uncharacterized protein YbbK (DUF523 family)
MPSFPRPAVVISRCIDFDACRFNGQVVRASLREELAPHVSFEPVCPELEIGLGVPRDPIRIVVRDGERRLLQPSTGRDLSSSMSRFASRYLRAVREVDGFILKSRSPSCAVSDSKLHPSVGGDAATGRGAGMFAAAVLGRFPHAAVEDEERLGDIGLRHHFLTKLFVVAGLRETIAQRSIGALVDFHARNKLLLMAYSERRMRELGRIVANRDGADAGPLGERYRDVMAAALARPPREGPNVNVLMHALGHVSDGLVSAERADFLWQVEDYRTRRLPLSALQARLASWAARLGVDYLEGQTYLAPFPRELVRIERLT